MKTRTHTDPTEAEPSLENERERNNNGVKAAISGKTKRVNSELQQKINVFRKKLLGPKNRLVSRKSTIIKEFLQNT